jgi:hypothetical protein
LAAKKFNQELRKDKLLTKKDLLKEAVLKYEEAILEVNKGAHDIRKSCLKDSNSESLKAVSDSFVRAKNFMNHAESLSRLAGLVQLADCYSVYSDDLNDLVRLFSFEEDIDYDEVNETLVRFGDYFNRIKPQVSTAIDQIYS